MAFVQLAWLVWPAAARAHVLTAGEPPADLLAWRFEPWVVALLALSLALYLLGYARLARRTARQRTDAAGPTQRRQQLAAFAAGWLGLVAALVSPLDGLGAALFSAHMLQHELLMIVAAPLLVLGRPLAIWLWVFPPRMRKEVGSAFRRPALRGTWRMLSAPLMAWTLHAVALWAWHAPALFQAALERPALHVLQHFTFLASALLFWWTAFPVSSTRGRAGYAMLALFTTMVHTAALGALLTLAPGLWYPDYMEPTTALGLDPLQDQQLGGLIMWVPGGIAYLAGGLVIASHWLLRQAGAGATTARGAATAASREPL